MGIPGFLLSIAFWACILGAGIYMLVSEAASVIAA
jgi:hypothetical protein